MILLIHNSQKTILTLLTPTLPQSVKLYESSHLFYRRCVLLWYGFSIIKSIIKWLSISLVISLILVLIDVFIVTPQLIDYINSFIIVKLVTGSLHLATKFLTWFSVGIVEDVCEWLNTYVKCETPWVIHPRLQPQTLWNFWYIVVHLLFASEVTMPFINLYVELRDSKSRKTTLPKRDKKTKDR